MRLAALSAGLADVRLHGAGDPDVDAITLDSRRAAAGAIFAALPGAHVDGRQFVASACRAGAVAVLCAAPRPRDLPPATPWIESAAPRRTVAEIARRLAGAPDERLKVLGITGTNGKTTTSFMFAGALEADGKSAAIGGTVGQRLPHGVIEQSLTTPEAPDLWSFLAAAEREQAWGAVLEVSSAALIADRVHGLRFAGAVLTNIGHDHLDVHGTHAEYRRAKRRLFDELADSAFAVLPADDAWFTEFRNAVRGRVVTFGQHAEADWRISEHRHAGHGARFVLQGPGFAGDVELARPGAWDAHNAAAAVAAATALGVPAAVAVRGVAATREVPGRWEAVDEGQPFLALVDYAHTPEALERTLELLRSVTRGRVIVAFGCGGDRDPAKRPAMGRIAGRLADNVIVTDDNPRSEDPDVIAAAILAGMRGGAAHAERVGDRAAAIRHAVGLAGAGDAVLITGKGHETQQEARGVRREFDDRIELRAALRARRERR